MDFFKNVSWYKFLYNNLWLEYLFFFEINSEDYVIVEINNINLDKVIKYFNENIILMFKYYYRDFNYEFFFKFLN